MQQYIATHRIRAENNMKRNEAKLEENKTEPHHNHPKTQAAKQLLDKLDSDRTAKRIARGEWVSEEEKQKLQTKEPEKYMKAEQANESRRWIERRLMYAQTKDDVRFILTNEKILAASFFEKGEEDYGVLFMEGALKAEQNFYERPLRKQNPIGIYPHITLLTHHHVPTWKAKFFDVRL